MGAKAKWNPDTMAKFAPINLQIDTSDTEAKLKEMIEKYTAEAVAEIDLSRWLGWGEGIAVLNCIICGGRTEGRITFVTDYGGTPRAMHKDCMVSTLAEAPTEMFEEIVQRLEQGDTLFGEDGE